MSQYNKWKNCKYGFLMRGFQPVLLRSWRATDFTTGNPQIHSYLLSD